MTMLLLSAGVGSVDQNVFGSELVFIPVVECFSELVSKQVLEVVPLPAVGVGDSLLSARVDVSARVNSHQRRRDPSVLEVWNRHRLDEQPMVARSLLGIRGHAAVHRHDVQVRRWR